MKKRFLVWTVFLMFIVLGVCGGAPPACADKELTFGILSALSGPAAPWGIANSRAMMLGAEKINEEGGFKIKGEIYKWKTMTYDQKYVPAEAVKALNKAIYSDRVNFVSVLGGAPLLACLPALKANNILSMNDASGGKSVTNQNNPLVFRFNPSIEGWYAALLPNLQKREKIKTMACLNPDDESGRGGLEGARWMSRFFQINVVAYEFFERGTKDFNAVLTRIIAKNPDLIETGQTDPTSSALILKQARELGYKGKILLTWGPDVAQVMKIAGHHAEGVYMNAMPSEPTNASQKDVRKRFLKHYPANEWKPGYYTHFTLIIALTKAIEKAQSLDPNKIAAALQDLTWDGPYGQSWFGGSKIYGIKRQLIMPVALSQIQKGKLVWLEMAPTPKGVLD